MLIEDPDSTETAESQAERETTIRIFRQSVPIRFVNPSSSAIVVMMQRLNAEDLAGTAIALNLGYKHLDAPYGVRARPALPHVHQVQGSSHL